MTKSPSERAAGPGLGRRKDHRYAAQARTAFLELYLQRRIEGATDGRVRPGREVGQGERAGFDGADVGRRALRAGQAALVGGRQADGIAGVERRAAGVGDVVGRRPAVQVQATELRIDRGRCRSDQGGDLKAGGAGGVADQVVSLITKRAADVR